MTEKNKNIYEILKYLNQDNVRKNINLEDEALKIQFDINAYNYDEAFKEITAKGYIYRRANNCITISDAGKTKFNELHVSWNNDEKLNAVDYFPKDKPLKNWNEFKWVFDTYLKNITLHIESPDQINQFSEELQKIEIYNVAHRAKQEIENLTLTHNNNAEALKKNIRIDLNKYSRL